MGLSLRDLASRSSVSAPMLSQVERGETSPTLSVAERIAHGLELSLSQLLRLDESAHVTVVRPSKRRITRRTGHRIEELTPPAAGQPAVVTLHSLRRGARTATPGDPPMHAAGSRETTVVESGRIVLAIDGERYELAEGDAATFDADLPHHFEALTDAWFLAVITEGRRR
jgi:transcriptional regulator with XRE-family HTH domain